MNLISSALSLGRQAAEVAVAGVGFYMMHSKLGNFIFSQLTHVSSNFHLLKTKDKVEITAKNQFNFLTCTNLAANLTLLVPTHAMKSVGFLLIEYGAIVGLRSVSYKTLLEARGWLTVSGPFENAEPRNLTRKQQKKIIIFKKPGVDGEKCVKDGKLFGATVAVISMVAFEYFFGSFVSPNFANTLPNVADFALPSLSLGSFAAAWFTKTATSTPGNAYVNPLTATFNKYIAPLTKLFAQKQVPVKDLVKA